MFDTFVTASGRGRRRLGKALTLCLSLLFHAILIAALVVVPLLRAEAGLPGLKVIDAALLSPPVLPGIPPAGRPRDKGGKPGTPGGEPAKPRPRPEKGFLVPTEIAMSTEEDLDLALPSGGSVNGVDGGIDLEGNENRPWRIGEEFIPEAVHAGKGPIIHVTPPRLVKRVNPDYPPLAIASRVSGTVVIAAATDAYGRVREAHVVSGHALLNAAAVEAVREWIYEPYLVNGVPMAVRFTVTVNFTLEKR